MQHSLESVTVMPFGKSGTRIASSADIATAASQDDSLNGTTLKEIIKSGVAILNQVALIGDTVKLVYDAKASRPTTDVVELSSKRGDADDDEYSSRARREVRKEKRAGPIVTVLLTVTGFALLPILVLEALAISAANKARNISTPIFKTRWEEQRRSVPD